MKLNDGRPITVGFRVMQVTRPILSVGQLLDSGFEVSFRGQPFIAKDGVKVPLVRHMNLFYLPVREYVGRRALGPPKPALAALGDEEGADEQKKEDDQKIPYVPVPRGLRVPPTEEEKEVHCATHMPFRPWCRLCCQAKAKDQPHWRRPEHKGIPVVEMDFCYAKTDSEQRSRPVFMAVDAETGSIFANLVEIKGRLDTMVVKGVLRWLLELGHASALRIRTDPEPAIMAIAQATARARGDVTTVVETSPVASKGSLGACERANQTFMGLLRTHKAEVEERLGIVLSMNNPLMGWLVQHVAWLHHRYNQVHGRTPFSAVQARVR